MTGDKAIKVGGLLLAAGGSSRLGRPKQLIEFEGKTLLRRSAEALVNSACKPIIVVLGAETTASGAELTGLPVNICLNGDWQTGMSSSIKAGLRDLLTLEPGLDAVMITLCDQPHVTSKKIDLFIADFNQSRTPIVAAQYRETVGVPALFAREFFNALLKLGGDKGARDLIRNRRDVSLIPLAEAAFDIDSPIDLSRLCPVSFS